MKNINEILNHITNNPSYDKLNIFLEIKRFVNILPLKLKSKADKFKGLTFEEYYNNHYKKTFIYDLKDILCGDFEKLIEIKNKLGKKDDNKIKSSQLSHIKPNSF